MLLLSARMPRIRSTIMGALRATDGSGQTVENVNLSRPLVTIKARRDLLSGNLHG